MTPNQTIESHIFLVRGHRVMFDSDLALIYGITTKRLRLPADFGFQLNPKELRNLRPQLATSSWGGRRYLPWVVTEHGALMLASVLSSPAAIQASIQVVRAFVRLRELLGNHKVLARRLDELEARDDGQFKAVFDAIRQLMDSAPEPPGRRIGFHPHP